MITRLTILTLFAFLCLVSCGKKDTDLRETTKSDFSKGQLWEYKTRENEGDSSFIVLRVDNNPKYGNIVHIYIQNVNISSDTQELNVVQHMPFTETALKLCSTQNIEDVELPEDWHEGYAKWLLAFKQGQAGVFSGSISEALDNLETTLNQK